MSHLETYLSGLPSDLADSIKNSSTEFVKNYVDTFSFNEHINGLLLGQVQSGKTGQMMGIITKVADQNDFKLFVLLTTDQVLLQQQTFKRALKSLENFCVCDESDEDKFLENAGIKPTLLVLKKNTKTLRTWANKIKGTPCYANAPLFIMDDEADAASLNTKINSGGKSTINSLLELIIEQSPSSIYVHTTATPQALILQTKISGWKPAFVHIFNPGNKYLGGDFFFNRDSPCRVETPDNELDILIKSNDIPPGLRRAVITFLISSAHIFIKEKGITNTLLIHPSSRKSEHSKVKNKIDELLKAIAKDLKNNSVLLVEEMKYEWSCLKNTEPKLVLFEEAIDFIKNNLLHKKINVQILNSENPIKSDYENGFNIVIGGNSLGRGITFPQLNFVYYCRSTKSPQADTTWQHSRIFGYDRYKNLCRIFSPQTLFKLFQDLNDSNNSLMSVIKKDGIEAVNLLIPDGVKPTRKNVLDKNEVSMTTGGVNYFPLLPREENLEHLDKLLGVIDQERDITLEEAISILKKIKSEPSDSWNRYSFENALSALGKQSNPLLKKCKLIVRTNRSISKGTGTLLSPTDRALSESISDKTVLVCYRINGEVSKGWNGNSLWIPNIKLPSGICFYQAS